MALPARSPAARPLASAPPTPRRPPEDAVASSDALSPEAEAFRREMRKGSKGADARFEDWHRSQRFGRVMFVVLRLALMTPGVLCFAVHAPRSASFGLEVAGFAIGWWLKRVRKRYYRTIVTWKDPLDEPGV